VEQRRGIGLVGTGVEFAVIALDALDLILRAQDKWHPLVNRGGCDIEYSVSAGRSPAAGLFDDHGHRVGFVKQPQAAGYIRILVVARVHEQSAAHQDAVYFGHDRCDPAHIEIRTAHAAFAAHAFGALSCRLNSHRTSSMSSRKAPNWWCWLIPRHGARACAMPWPRSNLKSRPAKIG